MAFRTICSRVSQERSAQLRVNKVSLCSSIFRPLPRLLPSSPRISFASSAAKLSVNFWPRLKRFRPPPTPPPPHRPRGGRFLAVFSFLPVQHAHSQTQPFNVLTANICLIRVPNQSWPRRNASDASKVSAIPRALGRNKYLMPK